MRKDTLTIDSGLVEVDINGVRIIKFNPSDEGVAEELYGLASKIQKIMEEKETAFKDTDDAAAHFDISRAEDREIRAAVDGFFGDGFCGDVFPGVRMMALSEGLTVIENFLYALLDKMDEDITANFAKRDARIRKYTEKYSKYKKKYHT